MKIAIIVESFPPQNMGGMEMAAYNIAKHLSKRNHEVHVITSGDNGLPKERIYNEVCVHYIKLCKTKIGIILFWIGIIISLKKIHPDIIHIHSISSGLPGFLAKLFLKIPYIVTCHGSDVYLKWKLKKMRANLVLKNANGVTALTNHMREEVQKIYSREVIVIPNGIDLNRFTILSTQGFRSRLGIKKNEKIIIFVGTLRPVKGVKYLIQAMKTIIQEKTTIRLILVGNGDEKQGLQEIVRELNLEKNIRFVGEVPNENIPMYLAAADIFVLPSLSEGFPIVVLEAMASGLPIVATDVTGLAEIIKDGVNGFLIEPRHPEDIAEKILFLLSNNEVLHRIAIQNKEEVKEYAWDNIIKEFEGIYSKALSIKGE